MMMVVMMRMLVWVGMRSVFSCLLQSLPDRAVSLAASLQPGGNRLSKACIAGDIKSNGDI